MSKRSVGRPPARRSDSLQNVAWKDWMRKAEERARWHVLVDTCVQPSVLVGGEQLDGIADDHVQSLYNKKPAKFKSDSWTMIRKNPKYF